MGDSSNPNGSASLSATVQVLDGDIGGVHLTASVSVTNAAPPLSSIWVRTGSDLVPASPAQRVGTELIML